MKTTIKTLAVFAILFALVTNTFASQTKLSTDDKKFKQAEQNLLVGISSENLGLKVSCAYMLGEMKSNEAIIPLTKILRNDEDERARIAAALALTKIGTERSVYVVKQAAKFDKFEKVRNICDRFYKAHELNEVNKNEMIKSIYAENSVK